MRKTFTLIELMIVVAIIAIIAAIAIPNLLESKKSANETNTGAAMKTFISAQNTYKTNNYSKVAANAGDFAGYANLNKLYCDSFEHLGGTNAHVNGAGTAIELISIVFADANAAAQAYNGYYFNDIATDANTGAAMNLKFNTGLCGNPAEYATTGANTFIVSAKGTVYVWDQGSTTAIVQWPLTATLTAGNTWTTW
jgi:prepilin-type N-terminal cleavage/methylation domain-containing protein